MPETIRGNSSAGADRHWASASSEERMKPTDSSSGVVCALPTTKAPASSTMNVSVMVPPASIARTRGLRLPAKCSLLYSGPRDYSGCDGLF